MDQFKKDCPSWEAMEGVFEVMFRTVRAIVSNLADDGTMVYKFAKIQAARVKALSSVHYSLLIEICRLFCKLLRWILLAVG